MFTDDLILFYKAYPASMQHIMNALQAFYEVVGLKANLTKSQVVVGGCSQEIKDQFLKLTGLKECQFPLKYLGLPIIASRLTRMKCRDLVSKILAKVDL